ncbi:hypothetical protein ACPPVW_17230 [Leifsonia sp. McL0607]|uniref:hypothetical protein n=1 Tax=Leifsonia sp. McL0607 TaxID=3415672 RepID=UPI003CFA48AF
MSDTDPGRRLPRYPRPEGFSATRTESAQDRQRNEALLDGLLGEIDQLTTRDADGYFDLEIGSALYLDDVAMYPLKASAPARISIRASIDLLMTSRVRGHLVFRDLARSGSLAWR